jgi:uncharacterized protein (DUF1697 family)
VTSTVRIALLRGINVGGSNKIPMSELRALCTTLGWTDVRSYIQSGNLVFGSRSAPADLERMLEREIQREFALAIPVVVRDVTAWERYTSTNPFPAESEREPNRVMLALAKRTLNSGAALELTAKARHGERVVQLGDALWFHFPEGSGASKLTPVLINKSAGSPATMRNWRTVLALARVASELPA